MKTKIISILALLLTVTQGAWAASVNCLPSDIGKVLGTDGKVYATVAAAGGISNVSGMIAYVNGTTGIAIGPSDLNWNGTDGSVTMTVSEATTACNVYYTKTRPSAATTSWRLPSQADFNNMIGANGCQSADNLRNMIGRQASSCGCYGMQTDEGYWSSTSPESGIYYNLWSTNCDAVASQDNKKYVRPCFTFAVTPNYTISFNANGGSGSVASQTKFEDTDITLPSNGFTRDGYTFAGWNTQADGNGTSYAAGATYSANAAVTLYAQWTCNTATSGIDWNPSTKSGTFLMPAYNVEVSTELWYILKQDGTTPAGNETKTNVFLDRTLQSLPGDNKGWNTFCAPFDISADKVTALGMTVKAFTGSTLSGGTLTLHFETASSIAAGTPYLVQVASNLNFAADGNEFAGVSQDWTPVDVNPDKGVATFKAALTPVSMAANDKTILFVTGGNALTFPNTDGDMKAFRAYFELSESVEARAFAMSFGDEITSIDHSTLNIDHSSDAVYDLQGRKLSNSQMKKGLYIQNGKKVIIK